MIFIITILLLAADFYYLKNIVGRRLVGLRWWNEVDPSTGESHWVFESSEPGTKVINPTDSRFFWIAIYAQPVFWILLALVAVLTFKFIWLPLVGGLPFSRCYVELESERGLRVNVTGVSSYRARPDNHQHPCLFAVRQVQPGIEYCGQRLQWWQPGGEHCEQHGWEVLYKVIEYTPSRNT
jgi:hypothetical protein